MRPTSLIALLLAAAGLATALPGQARPAAGVAAATAAEFHEPAARDADTARHASETLRKIQQTGTITLGHRQSSVPFSYYDSRKQVVGYAHDLSTLVSQAIRRALRLPALTTKLVPVTAQNRIPMVVSGNVDLECGSTTHNLERARQVLFSNSFFVISTRLMVHRGSGIQDFKDLAGKRVVVTAGTTSERLIRTFAESSGLKFQILTAREHEESFGTLERGQADAFMMDDALLYGERAKAQQPLDWIVVGQPMTREAYGCMMRKGDLQLKRIVDEEIARLMRSGELLALYRKWFERPITAKGLNLNWPPSQDVLELFANPNDRPLQ
ncbi:MAG: transporter substrate-binding domain-containing protein [Pseudorhodoferax sp.]